MLPDSKTVHNGSMYSSSVTTGDFEQFIAHDVVAYIDSHYRTIPKRTSRGLVGHSMGGYGASRIGMKHSDVFGSLYIMSPCCMAPRQAGPANPRERKGARSRQVAGRLGEAALRPARAACVGRRMVAESEESAAVPRSADQGRRSAAGRHREWAANAPLAFVDQYIGNLRQYRGSRSTSAIRTACEPARQAARDSRQLRHREHLRDLSGHSHERGRRPVSELRHAVLQARISAQAVTANEAPRRASTY